MSGVRTVLGDVDAAHLGRVDAHDHLLIAGGPATERDPDVRISDLGDAVAEARAFRSAGGGTIVDAMPSGCGRDVEGLVSVAREAGINVIATAGFHTEAYYGDLSWRRRYPVSLLARVLLEECTLGIDRWDVSGPLVERTSVRPGLLKCAFGMNAITAAQERGAVAVAEVHRATGLPVLVHLEHGTGGDRVLDLLSREGVALDAVALSHVDRTIDLPYHAELAGRGARLCYDGLGRERYRPTSAVVTLIGELAARGFADRLLLGGDIARRSARRSNGGDGIAGLLTRLAPRIAAAVGEALLDRILVANPAQYFPIRHPAPTS